jgi:hypothetical protein
MKYFCLFLLFYFPFFTSNIISKKKKLQFVFHSHYIQHGQPKSEQDLEQILKSLDLVW